MTRQEYNEFRYIRKNIKEFPPRHGCTYTIKVEANRDYKSRLDSLYRANNLHPATVKTDPHMYDDNERIIYLYGADEVYTDSFGRPFTWEDLYTPAEKERIAEALAR